MTNSYRGILSLTMAALIWGCAFVAQSIGNDLIGPFTFNMMRSIVGALSLLPVYFYFNKKSHASYDLYKTVKTGIICGIILAIASLLQQVSMLYVPVGKAGFITGLYIVFVPIFSIIFFKKTVSKNIWIAVIVAIIGFTFITNISNFELNIGEKLLLISAIFFAFHILTIDHMLVNTNVILLSSIQFVTGAIISAILAFIFEDVELTTILSAYIPILYAGVMSSGVAYTLQILGQKYTEPSVASLIMSLETVFSVIAGYFILHEVLTIKELIGCALIFIAIIFTQTGKQNEKE